MRFLILAVGRARAGPEQALYDHYARRMGDGLALREVEERRSLPSDKLRQREAALLLDALPPRGPVVALDERGKSLGSRALAERIGNWRDEGHPQLSLLIGGADGHGKAVLARADLVLSLGAMTWPHMLVRGLLAEQLYRAQCILSGHPYHRD